MNKPLLDEEVLLTPFTAASPDSDSVLQNVENGLPVLYYDPPFIPQWMPAFLFAQKDSGSLMLMEEPFSLAPLLELPLACSTLHTESKCTISNPTTKQFKSLAPLSHSDSFLHQPHFKGITVGREVENCMAELSIRNNRSVYFMFRTAEEKRNSCDTIQREIQSAHPSEPFLADMHRSLEDFPLLSKCLKMYGLQGELKHKRYIIALWLVIFFCIPESMYLLVAFSKFGQQVGSLILIAFSAFMNVLIISFFAFCVRFVRKSSFHQVFQIYPCPRHLFKSELVNKIERNFRICITGTILFSLPAAAIIIFVVPQPFLSDLSTALRIFFFLASVLMYCLWFILCSCLVCLFLLSCEACISSIQSHMTAIEWLIERKQYRRASARLLGLSATTTRLSRSWTLPIVSIDIALFCTFVFFIAADYLNYLLLAFVLVVTILASFSIPICRVNAATFSFLSKLEWTLGNASSTSATSSSSSSGKEEQNPEILASLCRSMRVSEQPSILILGMRFSYQSVVRLGYLFGAGVVVIGGKLVVLSNSTV